jgi:very-short-patch-repair endonuclease
MKHDSSTRARGIRVVLANQHGLISRTQALGRGMSSASIRRRVATGEWEQVQRGVYRSTSAPVTSEQRLLAACLAAGPEAAASHLSAAWLMDLVPHPPPQPVITIPYRLHVAPWHTTVHRSRDVHLGRVTRRRLIPCVDPLRTLCDLAGTISPAELHEICDRAVSRRFVTIQQMETEVRRERGRGRRGPAALRRMLTERGFVGGPPPSVLEAKTMRLFRAWRIPVLKREIVYGQEGQYRIDFLIAPGLCVEVDGFAHHWSPEAKARDEHRRNQLRLQGLFVLVYSWRDVRNDDRRIAAEVRAALAAQ